MLKSKSVSERLFSVVPKRFFDFCDSYTAAERMAEGQPHYADCLLNHGNVPLLTAALLQRGMDEETVRKIVGENFVQYFRKMLPKTS